ncbi:hypothetical protein VTI74DRAFT_3655 [Chaetomium olivicolor]
MQPIDVKNKTDSEALEKLAREIGLKKDDLEYSEERSRSTVAVYMDIPFSESVTLGDESQPASGVWIYRLGDIPEEKWTATDGVRIRFVNKK